MEENEPKIIKICDLLKIENLSIPDYQRPYAWTEEETGCYSKTCIIPIRIRKILIS